MQRRTHADGPPAEPVKREIHRVPPVVHQDAAPRDCRIAAPVGTSRVGAGGFTGPAGFDLHTPERADGSGEERLGRVANDRGVFPVVHRQDGNAPLGRDPADDIEDDRVEQKGFFAEYVPSAGDRVEHRT